MNSPDRRIAPHRSRNCRLRNRHSAMLRSRSVKKRHILVVHDEPDVREKSAQVLKAEGYEIIQAESAERAMELARSNAIDTFLINIDMPGCSGIEICRKLRATEPYKFTPVILCAKLGLHDQTIAAYESGCNDVIVG